MLTQDNKKATDAGLSAYYVWGLLLLILAGAGFLRLFCLECESLWNDELATWDMSHYDTLADAWVLGIQPDVHPPAYQVLMFFIIKLFGDSEYVLRLPSVITGILSVAAIYLVAKELYSRQEGLIAAAVMAVSWAPINYSQEARSNSLLMLSTMLVIYFWLRVSKTLASPQADVRTLLKYSTGFVITVALTAYTHYFGLQIVVLICAFGLLLNLRHPRRLLYWGVLGGVLVLVYAPWLPSFYAQFTAERQEGFITAPGFVATVSEQLAFSFRTYGWLVLLLVLPVTGYFLVTDFAGIYRKRAGLPITQIIMYPSVFLLLWIGIPILAAYVQSQISTPVVTARNLITTLPAFYILFARGLAIIRPAPLKLAAIVLFLLGTMHWLLFSQQFYTMKTKDQFREAAGHMIDKKMLFAPGPVYAYTRRKTFYEYYFNQLQVNQSIDLHIKSQAGIAGLIKHFEASGRSGFWLLSGHLRPAGESLDLLGRRFCLQEAARFYRASARFYQLRHGQSCLKEQR